MKFRLALAAATVLAAPLALPRAAVAQPITGPYVNLGAGYDIESTTKAKNLTLNGVGVPGKEDILNNNGYAVDGAVGYGLGNGFRVEIEGDFGRNHNDKIRIDGTALHSSRFEERYGAFVNAYYDFDLGLPMGITPYLGAGIGYQDTYIHNLSAPLDIEKTKGALAYQGIAGVAYPIAYIPGLSATLEYRFIGITGSRKLNFGYPYPTSTQPASIKFGNEYDNEIRAGVIYAFGAPAPMAPPPAPTPVPVAAPAPAPAKTYLVFFDWDKSDLTPRATQIIAQAASDSKTQQTTTIDVSGYTDTSGTPTYNQGLSERRAQAVAAQLVTDGVPMSEISTHAYGETHLLVPTGPGVREPQNRRVEIVLQ
jgi:outer membrane protein OmpA-like peptidoglycan-associated protein